MYIVTSLAASTALAQPPIIPPSPVKMNGAGAVLPALVILKSVVPLKTIPVGSNVTAPLGGRSTTRGMILPVPSYSVEVGSLLACAWLFAIQTGAVGANTRPQGLSRLGSVTFAAVPATSETRSVRV